MEDYLIGIGRRIRKLRTEKNLQASELARRADVSKSLISRIENGRAIPSLPVMLSIIAALGEDANTFFDGIPAPRSARYLVVRPDDHEKTDKEAADGFEYGVILSRNLLTIGFEMVLLSIAPGAERDKVVTDAFEIKYVLEGECEYVIGDNVVPLSEGDTLFFDGRIPHVPRNPGDRRLRMLVLYLYIENSVTNLTYNQAKA